MDSSLSIGEVAARTGLAVSAVRFYADGGLIESERSPVGHRRFRRATIRRLSFILICQKLGYSLAEITAVLDSLPSGRTPTEADWQRLSRQFALKLQSRIDSLETLKEKLDGCIGCGCLSLRACQLWNPEDGASNLGTGPRFLLGDSAGDLRGVLNLEK